jgi:transposase
VVHANAPLTEKHRLVLAKLIVEEGLPIAQAAQRFQIAWPTAKRWADRYRAEGEADMRDRSSRPHSPRTTPPRRVRAIVRDRVRLHLGRSRSAPARACPPPRCTAC